jgi:hypothetical protein
VNTGEAVRLLMEVLWRTHFALAMERSYCAKLSQYSDDLKRFPFHFPQEMSPPAPKVKPLAPLSPRSD